MNAIPLFVTVPFNHAFTRAVTSTTTNSPASPVPRTMVASTAPIVGSALPLIADSTQGVRMRFRLIVPEAPTALAKIASVALLTVAPVVPAGSVERSNLIQPLRLVDVATLMTPVVPKFVPFPVVVYVSSDSFAGTADATGGRTSSRALH